MKDDPKLMYCPALTAIRVISGKWKTRVLWLLRARPHHFGELRDALVPVSAKVLSDQLRQLAADGVIEATPETRGGVDHMIYAYTDYGRSLIPALDLLGEWGLRHGFGEAGPR